MSLRIRLGYCSATITNLSLALNYDQSQSTCNWSSSHYTRVYWSILAIPTLSTPTCCTETCSLVKGVICIWSLCIYRSFLCTNIGHGLWLESWLRHARRLPQQCVKCQHARERIHSIFYESSMVQRQKPLSGTGTLFVFATQVRKLAFNRFISYPSLKQKLVWKGSNKGFGEAPKKRDWSTLERSWAWWIKAVWVGGCLYVKDGWPCCMSWPGTHCRTLRE